MQREMSRFRKLKFEHQRINVGVLNQGDAKGNEPFPQTKV